VLVLAFPNLLQLLCLGKLSWASGRIFVDMSPSVSVILRPHDYLVRGGLVLDELTCLGSELFVLSKKVVVVAAEVQQGHDFCVGEVTVDLAEDPASFLDEEFR